VQKTFCAKKYLTPGKDASMGKKNILYLVRRRPIKREHSSEGVLQSVEKIW
jgi:hypothetical protein